MERAHGTVAKTDWARTRKRRGWGRRSGYSGVGVATTTLKLLSLEVLRHSVLKDSVLGML